MQAGRRAFLSNAVISAISFYRNYLSKMVLHYCRFFPSCSIYAIESIRRDGLILGGWRAVGRVCRCHPFSKGGFDPVPPPVYQGGSSRQPKAALVRGSTDTLGCAEGAPRQVGG